MWSDLCGFFHGMLVTSQWIATVAVPVMFLVHTW
jgi:hypothetical protein